MSDNTDVLSSGGTQHMAGVGVLLSSEANKPLISWSPIGYRIIVIRLATKYMKVTVVQH